MRTIPIRPFSSIKQVLLGAQNYIDLTRLETILSGPGSIIQKVNALNNSTECLKEKFYQILDKDMPEGIASTRRLRDKREQFVQEVTEFILKLPIDKRRDFLNTLHKPFAHSVLGSLVLKLPVDERRDFLNTIDRSQMSIDLLIKLFMQKLASSQNLTPSQKNVLEILNSGCDLNAIVDRLLKEPDECKRYKIMSVFPDDIHQELLLKLAIKKGSQTKGVYKRLTALCH